ncbi:hypothetical protein EU556_21465 [Hymenobacter fodinae]|uniref:Uncharacterized protein n=1 Tax=Hymenobacter fodinae TaxID=2510796 RepID=A0A4Z0P1T2_9BACT|nr:hypothetical protein EU556_21465 [Hymenobacter fodinae]
MTYSVCLPRYVPRYSLLWPPPSWQQVVAGLPLLPNHFLAVCIAVLPSYTFLVVLLDVGSVMPTPVLAGLVGAVIGVAAWLLNRTVAGFDASTKETKDAVHQLRELVTEMRLERKDDRQLVNYLKERQDKLEDENTSLRKSVTAFDVFLEVQKASGKVKP